MKNKNKESRRTFLVRGGIGTIGIIALGSCVLTNPIRRVGLDMVENTVAPYIGKGTKANLWIEILQNNTIVLHSSKVEMGQGTFTGLAQIVADELDISMDQIQVIAASTDRGILDRTSTGGSFSIASLWMPLREMGATMREMLKMEASKKWNIPVAQLSTNNGVISNGSQSITYATIASEVEKWKLPKTPKLRPTNSYKFTGKPIKRVDLKQKVFGDPIFGMDAELPGMVHACVVRPEHVGASFRSADTSQAESMPGVIQIIKKETWVGVIAASISQALAAKRTIKVEWDIPKKWTEEGIRELLQVGKGNRMITQKEGKALDPEDKDVISIDFSSPIGAHAQMEPNGAVAAVEGDKATIILSTQVVGITQKQVSKALGIPLKNVNIIPTFLGGGFGRRLNTSHAVQAAIMAKEVGRPVKYFFTRKEEFQNDTFRPPTHHTLRGKLDQKGYLESLEHHYASGDVAINSVLLPGIVNSILGSDVGAMRGANIMYDAIENHRSVQWHTTLPFATSWWRSLGLLANTFAIESFVDEMCIKANKDPFEFRLSKISNKGYGKRIKGVIKRAAEISNYNDKIQNERAMGMAASIDSSSPCAHVVEVSIENKKIIVHKVLCVFDCGVAVNPDQVRAQCEGAIIMGMSGAIHEKMTLKDGQLYPTNYGPYDMALMKDVPKEIEVVLIEGADKPYPVGEPPMGPIAAAIGNAIRRLTGNRLTDLPLKIT